MSAKRYQKALQFMTNKEKDLMTDLYMSGINCNGHIYVTFGDVEKVIRAIILGRLEDELHGSEGVPSERQAKF